METIFFKITDKNYSKSAAENEKYLVLNGSKCEDLNSFYKELHTLFRFPSGFGKNLDALYDTLCDLEWINEANICLHIINYTDLLSSEDIELKLEFLNLLNDVAINWSELNDEEMDDASVFPLKKFMISIELAKSLEKDLYECDIVFEKSN